MSEVLTVVIGAVAGALLTGGAQMVIAANDRTREARTAARLLMMKLHSADAALKCIEDAKAWAPPGLDLGQYMVAWEKRSDALSRVLDTQEALDVDGAFGLIDALALSKSEDVAKAADTGQPIGFSFPLGTVPEYRRQIKAAKLIVYRASFTESEKRLGKVAPLGPLWSETEPLPEPPSPTAPGGE